jgi:hypothetical protein
VKVHAAILARQNVLQAYNEVAVLVLLLPGGVDGVVKTHRVQKMPHSRTPYAGKHPVTAAIIALFKRAIMDTATTSAIMC